MAQRFLKINNYKIMARFCNNLLLFFYLKVLYSYINERELFERKTNYHNFELGVPMTQWLFSRTHCLFIEI